MGLQRPSPTTKDHTCQFDLDYSRRASKIEAYPLSFPENPRGVGEQTGTVSTDPSKGEQEKRFHDAF
jgi:hypothetical protein